MTKKVTPFRVLSHPQEYTWFPGLYNKEQNQTGQCPFLNHATPFEIYQQTRGSVGSRLHTAGWASQHLLLKDFVISNPATCLLKKLDLGKH